MKKGFINIFVLVVSVFVFVSCGDSEQTAGTVPLPKAWPRLDAPITADRTEVTGLPVPVSINPSAKYSVLEVNPPGLTVDYPKHGVSIYYTFVPVRDEESLERVLDARRERIGLNLNGREADVYETTPSSGGEGALIVARSVSQFPVQLLVHQSDWIVSATAFVHNPVTDYDSISPLVDMLEYDMRRTLPGIEFVKSDK